MPVSDPVSATSANAACVGNERVSMAGFTSTINFDQAALVSAMAPSVTGVKASAFNPGDPGTLTAIAYCTPPPKAKKKKKKKKKKHAAPAKKKKKKKKKKPAPPPQVVSATSPITPIGANFATATVTCPSGKTVRAGGFEAGVTADDGYSLSSLELLSPTQLKVVVDEFGFGAVQTTVTAIALCGTGPALTTAAGPAAIIPEDGTGASTASCPAGKTVAFGGVKEGIAGGAYISSLTRSSNTAVTASAFSFNPNDTVQAIAYCA